MHFALQANNVAYGIHYSRMIGTSYTTMGDIHSESGQNKLALEYYRLSVPYLEKAEIYADLSKTFLGMAKLFEKNSQNDSSLIYAKQSFLKAIETANLNYEFFTKLKKGLEIQLFNTILISRENLVS